MKTKKPIWKTAKKILVVLVLLAIVILCKTSGQSKTAPAQEMLTKMLKNWMDE